MNALKIYNRSLKKVVDEAVYGQAALRALYPQSRCAQILIWPFLQLVCRMPLVSRLYGYMQSRTSSKKKIEPFIRAYGVDRSEFAQPEFESFNAFFTRQLAPGARPIGEGIIAPADGRYRFIQNISEAQYFYAKGQRFNLATFLDDPALCKRFEGGSALIARLAPPDYHRFHFPISGKASQPTLIEGPLFSVNPLSLRKKLTHLTQNKRWRSLIEGPKGAALMCEIGATCVGSVHYHDCGSVVKKGTEKGYFSFGASAVVVLFEPDQIIFEPDLFEGPAELEVQCKMGETIARFVKT
jgi:phosphatidylserine decarboxylase